MENKKTPNINSIGIGNDNHVNNKNNGKNWLNEKIIEIKREKLFFNNHFKIYISFLYISIWNKE